jgi:hypothetical protein
MHWRATHSVVDLGHADGKHGPLIGVLAHVVIQTEAVFCCLGTRDSESESRARCCAARWLKYFQLPKPRLSPPALLCSCALTPCRQGLQIHACETSMRKLNGRPKHCQSAPLLHADSPTPCHLAEQPKVQCSVSRSKYAQVDEAKHKVLWVSSLLSSYFRGDLMLLLDSVEERSMHLITHVWERWVCGGPTISPWAPRLSSRQPHVSPFATGCRSDQSPSGTIRAKRM